MVVVVATMYFFLVVGDNKLECNTKVGIIFVMASYGKKIKKILSPRQRPYIPYHYVPCIYKVTIVNDDDKNPAYGRH